MELILRQRQSERHKRGSVASSPVAPGGGLAGRRLLGSLLLGGGTTGGLLLGHDSRSFRRPGGSVDPGAAREHSVESPARLAGGRGRRFRGGGSSHSFGTRFLGGSARAGTRVPESTARSTRESKPRDHSIGPTGGSRPAGSRGRVTPFRRRNAAFPRGI